MIARARVLACAALFLLASAFAEAGSEEIHFEKGKSSAVLRGTVHLKGGWDTSAPRYQLRVGEGQTLTVHFKGDPGASYAVTCPGGGGTESGASDWSLILPESGLLTLDLHGRGDRAAGEKDLGYELEVAVTGKRHKVPIAGVTGTYSRTGSQDGTLEVVEMPGGKLRFHWDGTWNPPGASPDEGRANIGLLAGIATLRKGKAVYDQDGCRLTMTFSKGDVEVDEKEAKFGSCGFGMNVRAGGSYNQVSRCAGPERWKDVD